jgi:Xaa-Pro aminopeptidase
MVRFLIWLEKALPTGKVSERRIAKKLNELRSKQDLYQGQSFETIAGFREHGAVVHYVSTPESDAKIRPPGILLVDSGGQYLDGTTDLTRTLALGKPTEEQKDRFTRVLKGHINLARQPFPQGTDGVQLDTLARSFLWEEGLNFGHGIGHGVGSYLNVHESPPSISFTRGRGSLPAPGMVCSNEPGYYKEGEYGLRHENLMVVREMPGFAEGKVPFLKLEPLTLCPVDLKLINKSLLSEEEIAWLNSYHDRVRERLSPHLEEEERTWLKAATRRI